MTIQVELLNKAPDRSVRVVYRDISVEVSKDHPAGITESNAGLLKPGERNAFWMHSNRQLLLIESEE